MMIRIKDSRIRVEKDFFSMFHINTGKYFRSGIIEHGIYTDRDPFMASFPELLDVGIMGKCIHGKKGLCMKAGIECYQNGLYADHPNMSLEDFECIARQCKDNTFQFALGGAGDPDQHESFEDILRICRQYDIVPNFTTSGLGMDERIAGLCKRYCGSVAVSWYRSGYTIKAIQRLLDAGVKTNIHYVLSKSTVNEAYEMLNHHAFPENVNAIVFLLHKPVGLGTKKNMIRFDDLTFWRLLELIDCNDFPYKIGFDSCTIPALINGTGNIDPVSIDTCEGARWSAYITPDMKMLPCSFDNQAQRWAVNLYEHTIQEAWESEAFEDFRDILRNACPDCNRRELCLGGCPICKEIVLCNKPQFHAY